MKEQEILSSFSEEAEKVAHFTIDNGVNLCKCPPYTQFALLHIKDLIWYSTKHYRYLLVKWVNFLNIYLPLLFW